MRVLHEITHVIKTAKNIKLCLNIFLCSWYHCLNIIFCDLLRGPFTYEVFNKSPNMCHKYAVDETSSLEMQPRLGSNS